MSKAVKIQIHKMMVKPVVAYRSENGKTGYMGGENIKDIWISGRARNIENKS
jgi:hypothetical protein